jgi:hydroxymethylglutaryl-CoA reductase (NADPH)
MNDLDEFVEEALRSNVPLNKLREFYPTLSENKAALVRAKMLERKTGFKLEKVSSVSLDFNELVGRNIENPIGGVIIPVGVVGPLLVNGSVAKGEVYLPLGTTEGALVASTNRGAKATYICGGITVASIKDEMTRAPLFKTSSIVESLKVKEWVESNFSKLEKAVKGVTTHGKLVKAECFFVGNNLFVRFSYSTGDAMGMNMVTIASERVCRLIEEQTGAKLVALSGNLCSDKKPAYVNTLLGRGKTVVAEATIKRSVVFDVLKTSPEEVVEINIRKNLLGSSFAGSFGQNAHFANIIAASFIAMGQDAAQTVESSQGFSFAEIRGEDLYFSVTLPSLEVGTVGGGTGIESQKQLIGLTGALNAPEGMRSKWLSEVIAAGVLAGELSLLAAIASNQLAESHSRLGRKRYTKS